MALYSFGVSLALYFEDKEQIWSRHSLQIYAKRYLVKPEFTATVNVAFTKATCNMTVSLCSAALSIWGLKRAEKMKKTAGNEKNRCGKDAATTIVYLNILIGLQFILLITSLVVKHKFLQHVTLMNYINFITYPFSNTLISAVNPLIYIVRCSKIRQGLLKRKPSQSQSGNPTLSDAK
jgi:hypothetical protein